VLFRWDGDWLVLIKGLEKPVRRVSQLLQRLHRGAPISLLLLIIGYPGPVRLQIFRHAPVNLRAEIVGEHAIYGEMRRAERTALCRTAVWGTFDATF